MPIGQLQTRKILETCHLALKRSQEAALLNSTREKMPMASKQDCHSDFGLTMDGYSLRTHWVGSSGIADTATVGDISGISISSIVTSGMASAGD